MVGMTSERVIPPSRCHVLVLLSIAVTIALIFSSMDDGASIYINAERGYYKTHMMAKSSKAKGWIQSPNNKIT